MIPRSSFHAVLLWIPVMFLPDPGLHGQPDESHVLTFKRHKGPVYSIAPHPDGNLVATGAEDRLIHLWDPHTGEILKTLEGHRQPVKYLEYSSCGRFLISAASTVIRIWDPANDSWVDYPEHVTHVYNLAFNGDASMFLSTSLKNKFLLWNREENQVIHEFTGHTSPALVVAWSPDGKWIASGSGDRTIRLWDAASLETRHIISAHGGNIYSLCFSPDSKLLASASMDENIKLWDVSTGKIHKLLSGHDYAVVYARFSPDGQYLVSASYDRTVKLWEVESGNCIYTFADQKDAIYAADFTPDGRYIITCSNDGTAMVYKMSPRFTAEYYYFNELENEMQESGLLEPRRRGESREDYRLRQEKARQLRQELYLKYHKKHLEKMKKP